VISVVKVQTWRWWYCDLQFGPPVSSFGPLAVKLGPNEMKIYKYVLLHFVIDQTSFDLAEHST